MQHEPRADLTPFCPFALLVAGALIGGLSLMGIQPAFFGFGFHF